MTATETHDSVHNVIAAFDIGSNSIKMTVGSWDEVRGLAETVWRSETVRLGSGIEATGRLADDRIEAALAVLHDFAAVARAEGATRLLGVATEATRVAQNGELFRHRVESECGIDLVTISGDREAELTFRGLKESLDLQGNVVIADIGGGSTELIVALDGDFVSGRSIPLGSGRLTDRLVSHDPPLDREMNACRNGAAKALASVPLPTSDVNRLLVVGGTGEYLTRLVPESAKITLLTVEGIAARLLQTRAEALARILEIPESRARVLPAGVAIVRALAERINPGAIEGARSGIRTGLLLAAFAGEL